jgi:hypothetical protein
VYSADQRPKPTSTSRNDEAHESHYLDWGNPSAPALLLLHGTRDQTSRPATWPSSGETSPAPCCSSPARSAGTWPACTRRHCSQGFRTPAVFVQRAGHWLHHDQLDRFIELSETFLA